MTTKQTKRARREAERLARRRRQLLGWAGIAVAVVLATVTIIVVGGSDDEAVAGAPDFTLETLAGDSLQLSDYRGRPVAVTFMHSY